MKPLGLRPLLFSFILLNLFCSGCTSVQPWEKGNLAKSHMAFDPDPQESSFRQRVYQSKEAARGGYGIEGGGCGCN